MKREIPNRELILKDPEIVTTNDGNGGPVSIYRQATIPAPESANKRELTWAELFAVLKRNRWLSASILVVVMVVAFVATLLTTPTFEATARLEIDPPSTDTFSLRNSPSLGPSDPDYLQTQAQILRSQALAIEVVRKLHLDQSPDVVGPPNRKPNLFRRTTARIRDLLVGPTAGQKHNIAGSPGELTLTPNESLALAVCERSLDVSAVRESNVVSVSFFGPNPALAAKITNTFVDAYIERNYQTQYDSTLEETRWLSKQLDDLRERVDKSNRALADFQNSNGIVELKDNSNTTAQTVEQLTQQLNTAKADRIQLEAEVKSLDQAGVDALPMTRNNILILDLSKMLAEATANLAQARAIYGENNANVQKYENQFNELQKQLNAERTRIAQSIRTSYASAVARQELLTRSLQGMTGQIHKMNETELTSSSLKKQVQVSEDLYNALFAKLKEAGISAGLRSSRIRIVDRALIPDQPVKPELKLNLAFALVLATMLAFGVPVCKELLAGRVYVPEDIRKLTGSVPIGVIPKVKAGSIRTIANDSIGRILASRGEQAKNGGGLLKPHSAFYSAVLGEEAIRNLCASIKLSRSRKPVRVVLVTSSVPGEGKTTVAAKLAQVLAQSIPTCLIDADLRNPAVSRMFDFESQNGLAQVLIGSTSLDSVMRGSREAKNLIIVPAGLPPSDAGKLICSEKMRDVVGTLSAQFQNIIIDSPPILPFADARALSQLADGVLLVGRSGLTTGGDLRMALELLAELEAPFLGVILNGLDERSSYYKTYKSAYAYGREK